MQMHKITTIAKRDDIATVRTKAFVFGLVVAPVLFGGGSIAMSFFKGKPDLKDRHVAVIDHTGVVAGALVSAGVWSGDWLRGATPESRRSGSRSGSRPSACSCRPRGRRREWCPRWPARTGRAPGLP